MFRHARLLSGYGAGSCTGDARAPPEPAAGAQEGEGASGRLSLPFTRVKRLESGSRSLTDTPVKQQHPPPSGHGGQRLTVSEVQWVPRMEQRTNDHPSRPVHLSRSKPGTADKKPGWAGSRRGTGTLSACPRVARPQPVPCPRSMSEFCFSTGVKPVSEPHLVSLSSQGGVLGRLFSFLFFSGVPNGQPFPWQRTARALLSL